MVGLVIRFECGSVFFRLSWPPKTSWWQMLPCKWGYVFQGNWWHCVSNIPEVSPGLRWLWWQLVMLIINIIIIILPLSKKIKSTKQSNIHTDTTTICSFPTIFPLPVTNRTKEIDDRRNYLASLTWLVQCDRRKFRAYQKICIIFEHLRTAFNVGWFQPLAQCLSCLKILNSSHPVKTQKETELQQYLVKLITMCTVQMS